MPSALNSEALLSTKSPSGRGLRVGRQKRVRQKKRDRRKSSTYDAMRGGAPEGGGRLAERVAFLGGRKKGKGRQEGRAAEQGAENNRREPCSERKKRKTFWKDESITSKMAPNVSGCKGTRPGKRFDRKPTDRGRKARGAAGRSPFFSLHEKIDFSWTQDGRRDS